MLQSFVINICGTYIINICGIYISIGEKILAVGNKQTQLCNCLIDRWYKETKRYISDSEYIFFRKIAFFILYRSFLNISAIFRYKFFKNYWNPLDYRILEVVMLILYKVTDNHKRLFRSWYWHSSISFESHKIIHIRSSSLRLF